VVRTALQWRIQGEDLVGTGHAPPPDRAGGRMEAAPAAVLLLNSGAAPRSGNSDLSVHIADRLALRGIPVFRFDFRGLGDSSGPVPEDLNSYWSAVVRGRNDDATAMLIERIRREFGIARVVVGGLCAAVLPSVRAASLFGAAPAGLILLEPDFRLALPRPTDGAPFARQADSFGVVEARVRRGLSALGIHSGGRVARTIRTLRAFLERLPTAWAGPRLPRGVNALLVADWEASLARGVPSLVAVAAAQQNDQYMARILEVVPPECVERVSYVRVPGTNHVFTGGWGREVVVAAIESWVMEHFGGEPAPAAAPPRRVPCESDPPRPEASVVGTAAGASA
jgi:pimeloyl-ACP methyl ester carboxylesterase